MYVLSLGVMPFVTGSINVLLHLRRELDGGIDAFLLCIDVIVEEVEIQCRLHNSRDPYYELHVILLGCIPVDPIEQVE